MPASTLTYSPEVAKAAARAFFWRKFRSQFGALYIAGFVVVPAMMVVWSYYFGPNWFVGALGAIFVLNLILQIVNYFGMPRALARLALNLASTGVEIETTRDGLKVSSGQSVSSFPWSTFKHVWMYDDFVLLVIGVPLASRFMHLPTQGMTAEVRQDLDSASRGQQTS